MAIRDLPRRPNLEHLRHEAKALQRGVRNAEPAALELAREHHPRFAQRRDGFRLSDAQLAIARSYGFTGWPRLRAFVEAIGTFARRPDELMSGTDDADEFLRLACLVYGSDDLARPAEAARRLAATPDLARHSIHTAAAAGDVDATTALLATDPALASKPGGPFDWEPLLYLAYSRLAGRHVEVAHLLLDHGAEPGAGYLWDGTYLFTALTGAFGYGEDAPNQPPHPQAQELARLLLDAGADPNDDQTIYNRHFRPDDDHLELLLEYGLGRTRRGPWPKRLGDRLTPPTLLVQDALAFAANEGYSERVALLLRHGVDPDGRGTQHPALKGRRPVESAQAHGSTAIVELLVAAGAAPPERDELSELLGRALQGDPEAVTQAAARRGRMIDRFPDALLEAADRGNLAGIRALVAVGYDVNGGAQHTPLHCAAYAGRREACELLVELGADPALRDRRFDAPPAGWARHAHHDALAAWLEGL